MGDLTLADPHLLSQKEERKKEREKANKTQKK
jgi:hypothetical protein